MNALARFIAAEGYVIAPFLVAPSAPTLSEKIITFRPAISFLKVETPGNTHIVITIDLTTKSNFTECYAQDFEGGDLPIPPRREQVHQLFVRFIITI